MIRAILRTGLALISLSVLSLPFSSGMSEQRDARDAAYGSIHDCGVDCCECEPGTSPALSEHGERICESTATALAVEMPVLYVSIVPQKTLHPPEEA